MNDQKDAVNTAFYYRWRKGGSPEELHERFTTGISLHGHTWHSFESLAFLPGAVKKLYFLPALLRWTEGKFQNKWKEPFDYSRGYWTSPVSAAAALHLESKQIASVGLTPIVSLTDHDSITAHGELRHEIPSDPVSLEWTAPYKGAIFHIGVHNLPVAESDAVLHMLLTYTDDAERAGTAAMAEGAGLGRLLAEIAAMPGTLVVFNHPLSDQGRIGFEIHESRVKEFLANHRASLHALEANALQPWHMNRRVAKMAAEAQLPIISGGDRHGFEPNGAVNLTNARTFAEFAHEIREEKKSSILFMPQTRRSLKLRYAENVKAVMDEYPDLPDRRYWYDRVFYRCPDGVTRSVAELIGRHSYAFDAMSLAVSALGVANLALRPVTPAFAESPKEISR